MKNQLEAFKKAWLLFGGKPVLVELLEAIIDKIEEPLDRLAQMEKDINQLRGK